ncbi:LACS4 [Scenedesmus sp. PABB004]|nr:LACS4 [Scenedesmus sp. PABB004]
MHCPASRARPGRCAQRTPLQRGPLGSRPARRRAAAAAAAAAGAEEPVVQVTFLSDDAPALTLDVPSGEQLRAAMLDGKVDLYTTWGKIWQCGGGGQCGTCIVQVAEGAELLSERTATEAKKLSKKPESWRLACQTIVGDGSSSGRVVIQTKPQNRTAPHAVRRRAAASQRAAWQRRRREPEAGATWSRARLRPRRRLLPRGASASRVRLGAAGPAALVAAAAGGARAASAPAPPPPPLLLLLLVGGGRGGGGGGGGGGKLAPPLPLLLALTPPLPAPLLLAPLLLLPPPAPPAPLLLLLALLPRAAMAPVASYLVPTGEVRPASGDTPSASRVYRNVVAKDGFPEAPGGVKTLYELFQTSVGKFGAEKLLGWRPVGADGKPGPYEWLSYAQTAARVEAVASGLAGLGVQPGQRVGVYGVNCPEWMIAMQACNRMSYQCVPLYDTLGENAIEFIIEHSEAVVAFADGAKLAPLAKAAAGIDTARFKTVVAWGKPNAAAVEALKGAGVEVLTFEALAAAGEAAPAPAVAPAPEDYCTIMYTSGTTGDPKGVLLRHSAVVATVASLLAFLAEVADKSIGVGDSMLSYLPLAHIFDRTAEEMLIAVGGAIGYWQGSVATLVDDIGALRPTLFIGVPRVFDRIYSRVTDQINEAGGVKKLLFNWGAARKLFYLKQGVPQDKAAPFFDRLVFSKVKTRLGGCVRLIVSGGAPLAPHVEEFLKVAMCAPVVQGYGLTETCAASCIAVPDVWAMHGTNGPATPCTELRLESVPEMNYDATDAAAPAGEVLLRGPQLFSGYYKQPEKTAEVMDAEGWFHTGDIGVVTPQGGLRIVDRKKNIFKLSQGEYIAVEKLEAIYKKAAPVEQVWVYGNSFKPSLVAVVVPKEDALQDWARANGKTGTVAELCADPAAEAWVLGELTAVGRANGTKGFEAIKGLLLEPEQFSVDNDCLTPTFKFKRPQLQKRYQAKIDALYAKVEAGEAAAAAAKKKAAAA